MKKIIMFSLLCFVCLFYGCSNDKISTTTSEQYFTNLSNTETKVFNSTLIPLSFSYPSSWGAAEESLTVPHAGTGKGYYINFSNNKNLTIGGRSKDFSEARSKIDTDFLGFENKTNTEICNSYQAASCETINDQMILLSRVPDYSEVCPNNPGAYTPAMLLAVNLPDVSSINGLVFIDNLISLADINCNTETENSWTEKMQTIKDAINLEKSIINYSNKFNGLETVYKSLEFSN